MGAASSVAASGIASGIGAPASDPFGDESTRAILASGAASGSGASATAKATENGAPPHALSKSTVVRIAVRIGDLASYQIDVHGSIIFKTSETFINSSVVRFAHGASRLGPGSAHGRRGPCSKGTPAIQGLAPSACAPTGEVTAPVAGTAPRPWPIDSPLFPERIAHSGPVQRPALHRAMLHAC